MAKKRSSYTFPIPKELLVNACNEASKHFGSCADSWGEEERCYVRKLCGEEYKHIESDLIGRMAISLRKSGSLEATRGGKTKRAFREPSGAYARYLKSNHWRNFRIKVLTFWGYRCCICKEKSNLEVHHNTYERIGHEELQDCIAVCRSCHKAIHFKMPEGNDEFELEDEVKAESSGISNENMLF